MIKNTIISGLLIYILSTCEGWVVEGFGKFFNLFLSNNMWQSIFHRIRVIYKGGYL